MKVMVAVDGSPASDAAVRGAVGLFGETPGVQFLLVSVTETTVPAVAIGPWGAATSAMAMSWEHLEQLRGAEARAAVEHAAAQLPGAERVLLGGDPAERICHAAEEHEVDVIVVGATDKGLVRRLLDPPVTDAVVHSTARPVLVVHDAA